MDERLILARDIARYPHLHHDDAIWAACDALAESRDAADRTLGREMRKALRQEAQARALRSGLRKDAAMSLIAWVVVAVAASLCALLVASFVLTAIEKAAYDVVWGEP